MTHVTITIPRPDVTLMRDAIDSLGNEAPLWLKALWGYLDKALADSAEEDALGGLIQVPEVVPHETLMAILADISSGAASGDTLEGYLNFTLPEDDSAPPQSFDIIAGYRIGNLQGQGGFRMIGRWDRRPK